MLRNPDWGMAELATHFGKSETWISAALARLAELSLAEKSPEAGDHWHTISPALGLASILARKEAELARHQQEVELSRGAVSALMAQYSALNVGSPRLESEFYTDLGEVRMKIEQLAREARHEVLAFAPGGVQPKEVLDNSRPLDEAVLGRGISMRTVYLESIRNDAASVGYARWLTDLGGQVRTVSTLPLRMIVVDRSTAMLPLDPAEARAGAFVVTSEGVITPLVALFERVWQDATPLGAPQRRDSYGLTSQEREVLHLLGLGLTDDGVARHLGISLRTVRRIMSELMTRMKVKSRFQAGLIAGALGWVADAETIKAPR
ncbi:helix-turn-helix domain-containing protein [Actinacidiphila yanglinensis]|nr:helix-turn-helix transcriptional regulator [Actinacidiphila yanglinensis]